MKANSPRCSDEGRRDGGWTRSGSEIDFWKRDAKDFVLVGDEMLMGGEEGFGGFEEVGCVGADEERCDGGSPITWGMEEEDKKIA